MPASPLLGKHVLSLVPDPEVSQAVVHAVDFMAGATVFQAKDAQQACTMLEAARKSPFDIVIIDISGAQANERFEVFSKAISMFEPLPKMIALSKEGTIGPIEVLEILGITLVTVPFSPHDLVSAITVYDPGDLD